MAEAGTLVEKPSGRVIAPRALRATSRFERTVGLIGKRSMDTANALWLPECGAIHTWFMRFRIDVAFLDEDCRVVKVCSSVPPWRAYVGARRARHTIEMAEGTIERMQIYTDDLIEFR